MKIRHLFRFRRGFRQIAAARFLVYLAVTVIFWPQNAIGQHAVVSKLSLSQIGDRVSHHFPDSTMHTEIQRRGFAFAPNPAMQIGRAHV